LIKRFIALWQLATALPSNSTLRKLLITGTRIDAHLPPVFLALGKNMGLKSLRIAVGESMDESLCTAMKDGLGMNATLETLELKHVRLTDGNSDLWCFPFSATTRLSSPC
jgi:hypothetical protein